MTLFEIFKIINKVAVSEPNVNTVVNTGNIFDLNTENWQVKYGAFCAQQEKHVQNGDFITYNFTLFYVDRLTDDKSNKLDVQSNAITTLMNVINGLKMIDLIDIDINVDYTTFTERFTASCAGAFCSLSVTSTSDICYDEFINRINFRIGDFNYDYSYAYFIKDYGFGEFNNDNYSDSYNLSYREEDLGDFSKAFAKDDREFPELFFEDTAHYPEFD